MISVVIRKSNGSVVRLVFGMKYVQRRRAFLGGEYLDRPIEQFANRLDFGIISVDAILTLSLYINREIFSSHKLGKVFLVSLLCESGALAQIYTYSK